MAGLFISYRREDSEGQARALFRDLCEVLDESTVFMDVDSIALGRDFRDVLRERLESCDSMLVLIGPRWLTSEGSAGRRLDEPDDYVRLEIAAALKRRIPVTPVLVQGARMPDPSQLPDDLKDLAHRNGFELSHTRWNSDVRELIQRLSLPPTHAEPHQPVRSWPARGWASGVGIFLLVALLVWVYEAYFASTPLLAGCTAFYGTYDMSLTLASGGPSCQPALSSQWTLSGNKDCSDFKAVETGSNITFRGTIGSNGKFKATGAGATIEGRATENQIEATDKNSACTFTVSGHR